MISNQVLLKLNKLNLRYTLKLWAERALLVNKFDDPQEFFISVVINKFKKAVFLLLDHQSLKRAVY